MRKILLGILIALMPVSAFADSFAMWQSSFTATAETAKSLCSDVGTGKRKGILHEVCIGDSGGSGLITVYNAYSTAVNPVTVLRSTSVITAGCINFDINMSSGIVYTTTAPNDKVTFIYQCF